MGYSIVPFTGKGDQEGSEANLRAFHVQVRAGKNAMTLQALDQDGRFLAGSVRRIRIVHPGRGAAAIILAVCLPLAAMAVVLALRRRMYFRQSHGPGARSGAGQT